MFGKPHSLFVPTLPIHKVYVVRQLRTQIAIVIPIVNGHLIYSVQLTQFHLKFQFSIATYHCISVIWKRESIIAFWKIALKY